MPNLSSLLASFFLVTLSWIGSFEGSTWKLKALRVGKGKSWKLWKGLHPVEYIIQPHRWRGEGKEAEKEWEKGKERERERESIIRRTLNDCHLETLLERLELLLGDFELPLGHVGWLLGVERIGDTARHENIQLQASLALLFFSLLSILSNAQRMEVRIDAKRHVK